MREKNIWIWIWRLGIHRLWKCNVWKIYVKWNLNWTKSHNCLFKSNWSLLAISPHASTPFILQGVRIYEEIFWKMFYDKCFMRKRSWLCLRLQSAFTLTAINASADYTHQLSTEMCVHWCLCVWKSITITIHSLSVFSISIYLSESNSLTIINRLFLNHKKTQEQTYSMMTIFHITLSVITIYCL